MTPEQMFLGWVLYQAAREYKKISDPEAPVTWLKHDETGEVVFIADSYNAARIMEVLE